MAGVLILDEGFAVTPGLCGQEQSPTVIDKHNTFLGAEFTTRTPGRFTIRQIPWSADNLDPIQ